MARINALEIEAKKFDDQLGFDSDFYSSVSSTVASLFPSEVGHAFGLQIDPPVDNNR